MPRIPFGLDRLPGALEPDDPRLPAAEVGAGTLRLNSEPLPPAVLAAAGEGHDGRVAALLAWLEAGCGDYARPLVDFMRSYVGFLETALAARHEELAATLARFDGLYAPRDWLWSAPRPLPRAWLPTPEGPRKARVAFWIDGAPLAIGLDPGGRDSAALRAAGIAVLDIGPAAPGARLPAAFHRFREDMALPASPFRRKLPPPTQGASPSPLAGEGWGGGCERRRPGAVRTPHPGPPPQGGRESASVPVTIVTGFLGSGKTTLLNRLLRDPALADTAVIVNEFGAVGLDHLLLETAIEDTVLLANGCICCTVRGDIADTLETLWERRAAGDLPPFRRIVIETTGLADPAPVAHALLGSPDARFACRLDGIVTTVDAVHGAAQLARQPEARRQVAMADRVLLTKTDLATPAEIAAAEAEIARLNPLAPLRHAIAGDAAAAEVFALAPDGDAAAARIARWLGEAPADRSWLNRHLPARHGAEIAATVLRRAEPVAWDALAGWLDSLLSLHGARVLRLKGIVQLAGAPRPVAVQAVHHVVHPPLPLDHPAAAQGGTRIVVIARGLPASGLRASFDAALDRR